MATTTKAILSKIKLNGEIKDLIAKSNGENTTVTYNGTEMTLAAALTEIFTSTISGTDVDTKISNAIDNLIGGAPNTYDTLKEISDYISSHEEVVTALNSAIGNKVDKADGKGLSTEDFTTTLKNKLDSLPSINSNDVTNWNNKASTDVATTTANGLMSASDKARLDGIRGVKVGETVPSDLQDGELFVQLVTETVTEA